VIGAVFLILGVTGVVSRLARALPSSIATGLQLGLGLSLAALGIRFSQRSLDRVRRMPEGIPKKVLFYA
jgi:xanthine/uracil/vitamin C permease (AzgA family)